MSKQTRQIFILLIGVASLAFSGCDLRPNWGAPGPTRVQRNRAVLHDPFPNNDLGPPIAGARPPGFEQPQSEATSLQSNPYTRKAAPYTPTYGF